MNNFYFSHCSIEHGSNISNGEYKTDLQKNLTKISDHTYDVELKLTIKKEGISLLVVANARFVYEADIYDSEEYIVNVNTVAIMFPFIRSQVSLLTTQPGIMPIILPPINTAKLVNNNN
ncbi:MAG TPA: preprotein translocase subunit SecB [Clostridium sp.]|nr:preprotein translocase subunit SecB [Clostridium sp.]